MKAKWAAYLGELEDLDIFPLKNFQIRKKMEKSGKKEKIPKRKKRKRGEEKN